MGCPSVMLMQFSPVVDARAPAREAAGTFTDPEPADREILDMGVLVRSPSTPNTPSQRQCDRCSGFPALLFFAVAKNQIVLYMIAFMFAGFPAKRQEELTDFSEETESCQQCNVSQWTYKVDRTFKKQGRKEPRAVEDSESILTHIAT